MGEDGGGPALPFHDLLLYERLKAFRGCHEDRQLSEVKYDHMIFRRYDASTPVAFLRPHDLAGLDIRAHQLRGSMRRSMQ